MPRPSAPALPRGAAGAGAALLAGAGTGVNSYRPREIQSRPSVPQNSIAAPVMPGASVASNVAVNAAGYSSSTLIVSGAVRPSL